MDSEQINHIGKLAYAGEFSKAHSLALELWPLNSQNIMLRFCLARLKNALGEWFESLELFDSVRGHGIFGGEYLTRKAPLWNGEPLLGKRIVVATEGGLGDIVCFARFAQHLHEKGAQVILATDAQMFPLLRTLPGSPILVDVKAIDAVDFDFWAPSLSLPRLLKIPYEEISGETYLFCPLAAQQKWQNLMGVKTKPRIGLIWQGNPKFAEDKYRSIPGEEIRVLLADERFEFVTTQSHHPENPLRDPRLKDYSHEIKDVMDLTGFCKNLDLLISVDSGPGHLAAAMGVPTLMINRLFGWLVFCYKQQHGLQKNSWYNSMYVLNQKEAFRWKNEMEWIKENLFNVLEKFTSPTKNDDIYHPDNPKGSQAPVQLVKTRYGELFTASNDFFVGRALSVYGEYAFFETEFLKKYVRTGDVVLDVGSHLGALSILFAQWVGATGRVISFEPQHFLRKILQLNKSWLDLPWLEVRSEALSDKTQKSFLPHLDYQRVGNFGALELAETTSGEEISFVRLDDLDFAKIDFIKMDIEGMECKALRGAQKTIRKHRPILSIEMDRPQQNEELLSFFKEHKYEVEIKTTPLYNPQNWKKETTNIYGSAASRNALAIPIEKKLFYPG
jgi:FkbM family methyltransferase